MSVMKTTTLYSFLLANLVLSSTLAFPQIATLEQNISSTTLLILDNDGDGVPDEIDQDDDNDGIPDGIEQGLDTDRDGIPNQFDLDSDNDGIADIIEAGFHLLSDGKDTMDLSAVWTDTNHNGWHDTAENYYASNSNTDTDGDSVPDYLDLDSDNDSRFDIDEAGLTFGDADANGDGIGDGPDDDQDGILNVFDNLNGFGNIGKILPLNTFGNGGFDYTKISSETPGVKDIATTIYAGLDTNNDGQIDGTSDIDHDGIMDAFDSNNTAFGSPRNLAGKFFIDFDGRNDYAQSIPLLGGLEKATIMGWIKLTAPYTTDGFIIGQETFNIKIKMSGDNKRLVATAKSQTSIFSENIETDRWYHVAAVYDGTADKKLKLYVNGKADNNATIIGTAAGALNPEFSKFTIGKNPTASAGYFKGAIDEVRVFNSALPENILQKMVYQEIRQNGSAVRGEIIPKDFENTTWASLLAYYRMDNFKDNVIDNYITNGIDEGAATGFARIYNVKNIRAQLAPMPFVTKSSGPFEASISQNNFVNASDAYTYNWAIIAIKHNINFSRNLSTIGMIIDPLVNVNLLNDIKLENSWYLKLDGTLVLNGKSQLVQTIDSELDASSEGTIQRGQQGQSNIYNYNYWCSPVGLQGATTNNNSFTLNGVLRDGTNPSAIQNINWSNGLDGAPTSPITISSYWIFKFQNTGPIYANWSWVGPNGPLFPGQGFTLKGSGALTPMQNFVFSGKPNNGLITIPINANYLNLTGNPYPSALDADVFIKDNISVINGTLYYWEHFNTNSSHNLADYQGGYAVRNLIGGVAPVASVAQSNFGAASKTPGRFIPVGQGFFVNARNATGNVTFNNNQRKFIKETSQVSNMLYRQNANDPVATRLSNQEDSYIDENNFAKIRIGYTSANNFHRQVLIGFMNEYATAGLDLGYDSENIDTQPNDLYLMNAGKKLIIAGESFFDENKILPIGVKTEVLGNVKFMIDDTEHFDENQPIYIYDNVTNEYHNLRNETFEINLPGGTLLTRFSIRFKNPDLLATNAFEEKEREVSVAFTSNNQTINIVNDKPDTVVKSVNLFNMLGQRLAGWDVTLQKQTEIQIPVENQSTGAYIVKVLTTDGDISKKIVIE